MPWAIEKKERKQGVGNRDGKRESQRGDESIRGREGKREILVGGGKGRVEVEEAGG